MGNEGAMEAYLSHCITHINEDDANIYTLFHHTVEIENGSKK